MSWIRILQALGVPVLAAVGGAAALLPQTVYLDLKTSTQQTYRNNDPMPVPPSVYYLANIVKEDLTASSALKEKYKLSGDKLSKIKLFVVNSIDLQRFGMPDFDYGLMVGLPEHFAEGHEHTLVAKLEKICAVDWDSYAGKYFKESLILSDDARKYAIASQFLSLHQNEIFHLYLNTMVATTAPYLIALGVHRRFNLGRLPKKVQFGLHAMIFITGFINWIFVKDVMTCAIERRVDKELAALGGSYKRGGHEYWSQVMLRNRSLRKILGKEGDKSYTLHGNEKYMLRSPHVSVTERLNFFKKELEGGLLHS